MNCQENPHTLHAYCDGELDPLRCLDVEQHLRACATCAQQYKAMQALRTSLRQDGLRLAAPDDLRKQIQAALRDTSPAQAPARRSHFSSLLMFGAGIAASFAILFATHFLNPSQNTDPLLAELTAGHVRSMMADHLMDVPSSNQHTVKPWFEGKLDFSPPVKDLAASGFPLSGGRLDYIAGRPVAALAYKGGQHIINLFIWPASADHSPGATQDYHGFHVVSWTQAGMACHAVSDINAKALGEFARAFQQE